MMNEREETRRAEEALIAFGAARNSTESMQVCRDYREALLSTAAQELVRKQAGVRRAGGDSIGAEQLEKTYRELRERLQSPKFMEMVDSVLRREIGPSGPSAEEAVKQVTPLYNTGRAQRDQGLHEQAESTYSRAVALDNQLSGVLAGEIWKQRGINQSQWGQQLVSSRDMTGAKAHFDQAIQCLDKAIDFNPLDGDALNYWTALRDMVRKMYP